ncbi:MAG: YbjQ family protein [Myxococcota bacterium]
MIGLYLLIFLSPFILVLFCGLIGIFLEYLHKKSILKREKLLETIKTTNLKRDHSNLEIEDSCLCRGSTTVASDYLKLFFASLRTIFGGQVRSYEILLERARREAILRMKAEAAAKKADMIINVRIQTSTIGNASSNKNANPMVEVIAYGTALISSK